MIGTKQDSGFGGDFRVFIFSLLWFPDGFQCLLKTDSHVHI